MVSSALKGVVDPRKWFNRGDTITVTDGHRQVVFGAEETVPGTPTLNIYRGMGLEALENHAEDRDCELKREALLQVQPRYSTLIAFATSRGAGPASAMRSCLWPRR